MFSSPQTKLPFLNQSVPNFQHQTQNRFQNHVHSQTQNNFAPNTNQQQPNHFPETLISVYPNQQTLLWKNKCLEDQIQTQNGHPTKGPQSQYKFESKLNNTKIVFLNRIISKPMKNHNLLFRNYSIFNQQNPTIQTLTPNNSRK